MSLYLRTTDGDGERKGETVDVGFGRTTNYYQDFNGSQDPGGRVIQLVARFDF